MNSASTREGQAGRSLSGVDDDTLMLGIARRDAASFRVVIDRHAATLHRVAYRMIGDSVEAEDMAQEALLRLWVNAVRWRAGGAGIGAWLTRVTMNACLDRLRKRRFMSEATVPDRIDEGLAADEQIDAARIRADAIAAVAALSDRQRGAIILTYYEDQSNADAAEALGMKLKAFESLLLRARSSLRKDLVGRALAASDGVVAQ